MGLEDEAAVSSAAGATRGQQVARALSSEGDDAGRLIERLRQTHDVLVLRFDADLGRIAAFNKIVAPSTASRRTKPAAPNSP